MSSSSSLNRRAYERAAVIGLGILLSAGLLLWFALRAASAGRAQLEVLARTEIQADTLAREFRTDVDRLNHALLQLDGPPTEHARTRVLELLGRLDEWVRQRQAAADAPEERAMVAELAHELARYRVEVTAALARPVGDEGAPAGGAAALAVLDDRSVAVQRLADGYAGVHMERLKATLRHSLEVVAYLRGVVFACVTLLVAGGGALGWILYRDFVRPLRRMVIDRDQALARREKLASLGTLAAGVAHEIRNPLTGMKGRLFALRRAPVDDVVRGDLSAIQADVERLERIVRDVLDYAHPREARPEELDLAAWLREVASALRPELEAASVRLEVSAPETLPARGDAGKLRQVALNLVRNAREAFGGRPGRVELSLREETGSLRGRTAPLAIFAVTDDGPGIPEEVRARLFDPFFTTKAGGTGLGLAIVAGIVDEHGGELALQTVPGGGTRFEVRLPLIAQPAAPALS